MLIKVHGGNDSPGGAKRCMGVCRMVHRDGRGMVHRGHMEQCTGGARRTVHRVQDSATGGRMVQQGAGWCTGEV